MRNTRLSSRLGLLATLGLFAVLTGCSVLPKAEPQTVYTLPEPKLEQQDASAQTGSTWTLKLLTPYSSRMVNSNRIVVQPDRREMSVYKGVRWSDPGPVMLRDYLVNAFRTQTRIDAVSSDSANLVADLELGGDLNRFQVEYRDGIPSVHIQLDAFLVRSSDSNIIASQRFFMIKPVDGKEVPEVVMAFGEAAEQLAAEITDWVVQHSPNGVKGRQ